MKSQINLFTAGYSNELGESFRPLIKKSYVHATYGVAVAYVFADTYDKSYKSYLKDRSLVQSAKVGGDVLAWQLLASVSSVMQQCIWFHFSCFLLGDDPRFHNKSHLLGCWKRLEACEVQAPYGQMDPNNCRISFHSFHHSPNR